VVRNWLFRLDGFDSRLSERKAPVLREIVDPEKRGRGSKQAAALERGNGGMNNGDKAEPLGFGRACFPRGLPLTCSSWVGRGVGEVEVHDSVEEASRRAERSRAKKPLYWYAWLPARLQSPTTAAYSLRAAITYYCIIMLHADLPSFHQVPILY
jgi:hypothetical protein